jgi:hypothetical protein
MLWVFLSSAKAREFFGIKINVIDQNPREKPGSVCFPPDTGTQVQLSAGH